MKKESLLGKWDIKRTICTPQKKVTAEMKGSGLFEFLNKEELLYREKLLHRAKGFYTVSAKKSYRYRFLKECVQMYFHEEEKGRLFMTFPIIEGKTEGSAWCGPDHYHMCWQWNSPSSFNIHYQVRGKKKDYVIESRFEKCP